MAVPEFIHMSIEDIVKQCIQDSEDWFPDVTGDLGFFLIALVGEVGEFANLLKKGIRGDGDTNNEAYHSLLAFELTDIFIYLMNIAGMMNVDLEKMYQVKREQNVGRFGQKASTKT